MAGFTFLHTHLESMEYYGKEQKKIIKLCYLQIAFYVVFLTSLLLHFKRGLDHRAFALLIILTLLGCASALTLTDYLKSLIRRSGFDVAGVHDKKSLEEKLLQLQNADDYTRCRRDDV